MHLSPTGPLRESTYEQSSAPAVAAVTTPVSALSSCGRQRHTVGAWRHHNPLRRRGRAGTVSLTLSEFVASQLPALSGISDDPTACSLLVDFTSGGKDCAGPRLVGVRATGRQQRR